MQQETLLYLSAYDEIYLINLDKVLYMQADDHYTEIHYASGMHFLVPFGLVKIEAQLADLGEEHSHLTRLGRKYIVNMRRVFRISTVKENIFLTDDLGNNITLHIPKPVLRTLIDNIKN